MSTTAPARKPATGQTTWRLREVLDEHGVSAYRLAQELSGRLSPQAVYNAARGMEYARWETIDAIIDGLRAITGKPIGVSDLIHKP